MQECEALNVYAKTLDTNPDWDNIADPVRDIMNDCTECFWVRTSRKRKNGEKEHSPTRKMPNPRDRFPTTTETASAETGLPPRGWPWLEPHCNTGRRMVQQSTMAHVRIGPSAVQFPSQGNTVASDNILEQDRGRQLGESTLPSSQLTNPHEHGSFIPTDDRVAGT
jgi:hypothetical protein